MRFSKEQEASGLLRSLEIRTPLSQVFLVGPFWLSSYKINKIINKFLLAEDKFMPEMHVRQPRFPHSPCRTFTKNKVRVQERIQKYKGTRDYIYIYIYI